MKIIVISSAPIVSINHQKFAYSPYVKEMIIWAKQADEMGFFCPIWKSDKGLLISKIPFSIAKLVVAKEFNMLSLGNFFKAIWDSFGNFYELFQVMKWADHIHLRCPGNIGLMAAMVQIFFPSKQKTAKYAGNWDPKSDQPWSYQLQKWILSNAFLTKNMQVLVYGEWEGSSKNIKPFFTASYHEKDKIAVTPRNIENSISIVFVGTLVTGKRPLYAIRLVEALHNKGISIQFSLYGNGNLKEDLQTYINENNLNHFIDIKGNQPQEVIKKAYQESHFVLLPSESEGWPKVIAEGMFWGCLPIATRVSCLPNILDNGNRGVLLNMNFDEDVHQILRLLENQEAYTDKVQKSIHWSRKYTLDLFENEIQALIHP